eukprot:gene16140-19205_t
MLKSTRLLSTVQPNTLSSLYGGYAPNSALVVSNRYSTTGTPVASNTVTGKIPDPQGAIKTSKLYHYSSIGVITLLPVSLLLPTSEITLISDCALGLVIPAHFYLGMDAVVNDYIYAKFPRFVTKALVAGSALVMLAGIVVIGKKTGLGAAVRTLWVK